MLTDAQKEADRLRSNMEAVQRKRTNSEMSLIIGRSSPTTWGKRLKDPENMTLREVRLLCKYLKVDRGKFVDGLLELS